MYFTHESLATIPGQLSLVMRAPISVKINTFGDPAELVRSVQSSEAGQSTTTRQNERDHQPSRLQDQAD